MTWSLGNRGHHLPLKFPFFFSFFFISPFLALPDTFFSLPTPWTFCHFKPVMPGSCQQFPPLFSLTSLPFLFFAFSYHIFVFGCVILQYCLGLRQTYLKCQLRHTPNRHLMNLMMSASHLTLHYHCPLKLAYDLHQPHTHTFTQRIHMNWWLSGRQNVI